LLALLALSFALRTRLVYDRIFVGDTVFFSVHDCWYHVRLVENLVHHFPRANGFDPYALFPGGQWVPVAPLLDWLLAAVSLIVGWGRVSDRTVDLVCAWAPPVLGTLVLLPVYWLGKQLSGRTCGLLAAALIAVSPGHFLTRSLLGYTDHHVLEVLLSTMMVLILASALGPTVRAAAPVAQHAAMGKPAVRVFVLGVLAGIATGLYLLTWIGGSLFVGILITWLLIQHVCDRLAGRTSEYLTILALPLLLAALLMVVPWRTHLTGVKYHVLVLVAGAGMTAVLSLLCWFSTKYRLSRRLFLGGLLAMAMAGLAIGVWISPSLFRGVLGEFARFGGGHIKSIIPEAEPLLRVGGEWSLQRAWTLFTTGFFAAVPAVMLLLWRGFRRGDARALLVAVWSVGMLAATLGQNRFAYYYSVNAALLTAYLGAVGLEWGWKFVSAGNRAKPQARGQAPSGKTDDPRRRQLGTSRWLRASCFSAGVIAVLAVTIYPNVRPAIKAAGQPFTPSADWMAALKWMREHTAEPFGDPNAYYALYSAPPQGEPYSYPDSAYGVMCSWGYGYWVTCIARRIPNANPGQKGAAAAAQFFLTQDEETANEIMDRCGSRYVIIDRSMPYLEASPNGQVTGKVESLAHWAGRPLARFSEVWYTRQPGGELSPFAVYHPEYYRSLLARLYVFRGAPYEPRETYVLSFAHRTDQRIGPYKELTSVSRFSTYAEALTYFNTQPPATTRMVGLSPYESCVPLEKGLRSYRLVYRSPSVRAIVRERQTSSVEVYEYTGASGANLDEARGR
jgi:dolichyl-diphosphooligosaccharide--protein glycosyltransferase